MSLLHPRNPGEIFHLKTSGIYDFNAVFREHMPGLRGEPSASEMLEEQMLQAAAEQEFEKAASFRDRIDDLREQDEDFARLFTEYHEVNRRVERTEEGLEAHADAYTEELKKQRLLLKDRLYHILQVNEVV